MHVYPVSSTSIKNLICQLDPIAFRAVDMFPQRIKKGVPDINILGKDAVIKVHCQETLYLSVF
jgi:hypothetical protein